MFQANSSNKEGNANKCVFYRPVFVYCRFNLLLIVTPIVGFSNCSMFCCSLLYVPSSFAIILIWKRELVALLSMSSWCLVIVVWLFLAVPWVCLQIVIVVFPDHTHYFISISKPCFGIKQKLLL